MKIIKRNGAEESFDTLKIVNAVQKACNATENAYLAPEQLTDIADYVEYKCNKLGRAVSVEEIQDMVENQLMAIGASAIAKNYVRYRYDRSLVRKANTTDNRILSLIECNNEEVMQENSNKNPTVNSVQRDYMAASPQPATLRPRSSRRLPATSTADRASALRISLRSFRYRE